MIGFVVVIKPLNITQCGYCKIDKQVSFNTDEINHKYRYSKTIHSKLSHFVINIFRDLFEIARILSGRAETLDDVEDEYQKELIGMAKVHRFVCGERKMFSMDNTKQA